MTQRSLEKGAAWDSVASNASGRVDDSTYVTCGVCGLWFCGSVSVDWLVFVYVRPGGMVASWTGVNMCLGECWLCL